MANIQAVLFDLDGTLADTALDLGGALNNLLRKRNLPEKPLAQILVLIIPIMHNGDKIILMNIISVLTMIPCCLTVQMS